MEAKVDIRKLQLLNDRINQTIDALNQVRLSVHGLSQTAGVQGQVPGFGMGVPFGGLGVSGIQGGFGPQAFGQFGQLGQTQGLGNWGGMSHTGAGGFGIGQNPYFGGQNPYLGGQQNPFFGGQNPYLGVQQNPFFAQALAMNPYLQTGISHTSPEAQQWLYQQQTQIDPYYGMRVSQTFPFAQLPVSPLG
jgi:hypothetical protein